MFGHVLGGNYKNQPIAEVLQPEEEFPVANIGYGSAVDILVESLAELANVTALLVATATVLTHVALRFVSGNRKYGFFVELAV